MLTAWVLGSGRAETAQWWDCLSSSNVVRVRLPKPFVISGSSLLLFCCWLSSCSEGFSPGPPVFFLPKPTFPNSNSTWREDPHETSFSLCGFLANYSNWVFLYAWSTIIPTSICFISRFITTGIPFKLVDPTRSQQLRTAARCLACEQLVINFFVIEVSNNIFSLWSEVPV